MCGAFGAICRARMGWKLLIVLESNFVNILIPLRNLNLDEWKAEVFKLVFESYAHTFRTERIWYCSLDWQVKNYLNLLTYNQRFLFLFSIQCNKRNNVKIWICRRMGVWNQQNDFESPWDKPDWMSPLNSIRLV